jgi:hypothetical protein
MSDDILNCLAQISIELNWILAVHPAYRIWALANVDLVFIRPFYPTVMLIFNSHRSTTSNARLTARS